MSTLNARPHSVITDPQLPARLRRLVRLPYQARAAGTWLQRLGRQVPHPQFVAIVALITLLAYISAQPTPMVAAAALAVLAAGSAIALAGGAALRARRRHRDRYVDFGTLSVPAQELLGRMHAAISQVLSSRVLKDGQLDPVATAAVLREHEWHVARVLRDAEDLAAAHRLLAAGTRSTVVDEVAQPQLAVLREVTAALTSRVVSLERYAGLVADADEAYLAWLRARKLAGLNGRFLDLLAAGTGPDPHAHEDLAMLADRAASAETAFRGTLARCDTSHAPEITLPDTAPPAQATPSS